MLHAEYGSRGIAPTRNCTHFPKFGLLVAGGGVLFLLYPLKINQIKKEKL